MTQADPPTEKKKSARKKAAAATPAPAPQANGADGDKGVFEDFDALSGYLADVTGKSQEVVREFFAAQAENPMKIATGQKSVDPLNVGEAFNEMMGALAADPGTVMQRQFNLWGDYARLMATMGRRVAGEDVKPAIEPDPGDKRFAHKAWRENPMLDFVKQSYLTYAKWLKTTVHQLEGMDEHDKKKAEFYTQQFLDAIAPTNFPVLNPEVIETTIESKGENILKGMKNLLEDLDRGDGTLAIRQADLEHFKLGVNIATTPGKVVYQNEIMQLIQYAPATEEVAKRPLLIFPPWINKFYIMDLQPKNSMIKWLVDQGHTVFLVSWVNPSEDMAEASFEDYVREGAYAAVQAVQDATGAERMNAVGYCIGGTMLAAALAHMAERAPRQMPARGQRRGFTELRRDHRRGAAFQYQPGAAARTG